MAVCRVEVLREGLDALPQHGALAAIGSTERFSFGRRARQFALEFGILGREGSAARAQGLDLTLQYGDLGATLGYTGQGQLPRRLRLR